MVLSHKAHGGKATGKERVSGALFGRKTNDRPGMRWKDSVKEDIWSMVGVRFVEDRI